MNLKKIIIIIISCCCFWVSIFTMDDAIANRKVRESSLQQLAYRRITQILQNELFLYQEPVNWVLKETANDLEAQIKKDFIKENSVIWWSTFVNTLKKLDFKFSDTVLYLVFSKDNNYLLIVGRKNSQYLAVILNISEGDLYLEKYFDDTNVLFEHDVKFYNVKKEISNMVDILKIFPDISLVSYKRNLSARSEYELDLNKKKIDFVKFRCFEKKILKCYYIPVLQKDETINFEECEKFLYRKKHSNSQLLKGFHRSHEFIVLKVSYKPFAITICADKTAKSWNLQTRECVYTINRDCDFNYRNSGASISSDGTFLLLLINKNSLRLYNTETGIPIMEFKTDNEISYITINEDNTLFGVVSKDTNCNKISVFKINQILYAFKIAQLCLVKLLYEEFQRFGPVAISSNSIWNQILKSFDSDLQKLIFEKFKVRISCSD